MIKNSDKTENFNPKVFLSYQYTIKICTSISASKYNYNQTNNNYYYYIDMKYIYNIRFYPYLLD